MEWSTKAYELHNRRGNERTSVHSRASFNDSGFEVPSALTDRRVTTGKKQLIYKGRRKEKKKQKVKQITLNEKEKPHSLLVPQISTYYHKDKKQKKKEKKKKEGKQQEAPVSSYALYTSVENSWEVEKDTWTDRLTKLHVSSHFPPPNLLYNDDIIQIFFDFPFSRLLTW